MKKNTYTIISIVLVIMTLFTTISFAFVIGDVDGDGTVASSDARLALRMSVGLEEAKSFADADGDGTVSAADARLILRAAVGLENFGEDNSTEEPSTKFEETTAKPEETTAAPTPVYKMPSTKAEIVEFYKKGVDDIKAGKAGYTKKEWQNVDAVNIGTSLINSAVTGILGNFMTVEADAEEQVNSKGSDEAKNRIGAWTLTDLSKVNSATCVQDGSNYKITIIMKDEDTPKKNKSFLGRATGSILYWEDIDSTLKNDPTVTKILTSYDNIHVIYKGYKIEAVMTPDGKFVSIDHTADIDIHIGEAKIIGIPIVDKSGHMWNYCKYYNFLYGAKNPDTDVPATQAPVTQAPVTQAPVGTGMPSTKAEIVEFYKKGVDDIKAGKVGYTKKEWQNVDAVNIGGSVVNDAVTSVLGSFMTVEADAEEQINPNRSDEAKNGIGAWTLTDMSKVNSATCVQDGSNYKLTIIMKDEDTPKKKNSFLGRATGSILYWEDIEETLTTDPTVTKILTGFKDIHVIYKGYKIEAVMTPDGKFVSIDHTADVDILIGQAKILMFNVENKSGHMWNYCKFYDFKY